MVNYHKVNHYCDLSKSRAEHEVMKESVRAQCYNTILVRNLQIFVMS
jgi:hypothetical protein